MEHTKMNYIDLFAGAGGLSEGFLQNGFSPLAHVEMNEDACLTLKTRLCYRMLKAGGNLVFTVEHPVFTAHGTQDWYYNEKGEILHFPVDNYYYEGKRTAMFFLHKKIQDEYSV